MMHNDTMLWLDRVASVISRVGVEDIGFFLSVAAARPFEKLGRFVLKICTDIMAVAVLHDDTAAFDLRVLIQAFHRDQLLRPGEFFSIPAADSARHMAGST